MSGQHARLSASAADRWMACPGSVKLSAGVAGKHSVYASYGTVLHDVAAYCLRFHMHPSGILTQDEDCAPVVAYVDYIALDRKSGDRAEIEVGLEELTRIDPDMGGTADYVRFRPSTGELLVVDFKTGSGVDVPAADNRQLQIYALGALLHLNVLAKSVKIVVIQPRLADPAQRQKEWKFVASDLLAFAAQLREAAQATRLETPPIVPGEDQCRWCPAGKAGKCDKRIKFKPKIMRPTVQVSGADFEALPATNF